MFRGTRPRLVVLVSVALLLAAALPLTTTADLVRTTLSATPGETVTITAGSSVEIAYGLAGDSQPAGDPDGCNATLADPVVVTLLLPAGVTSSVPDFQFTGCGSGNAQTVTFSSATPGVHPISTSIDGGVPGSQFINNSQFFLEVELGTIEQDFDGVTAPDLPTDDGWSSVSLNAGIAWVTTTATAHTEPNAAFINGNNFVISDTALVSPTFLGFDGYVSFQHQYGFAVNFDGGVLEISIDGGDWQDILDAGGSFLQGGYIAQLAASPLLSRAAWTGDTGGAFIRTVVELPAEADGQPVQLRWRMATDTILRSLGWYVDSIEIIEDDEPPVLTVPDDIVVPADSLDGAVVDYPAPSATDNVDPDPVVECESAPTPGLGPGSLFPIGTTTISCTATDFNNNQSQGSFTVTVELISQGCLYAGSLSQVSYLFGTTDPSVGCSRGTPVTLVAGEDIFACQFAGALSQVNTTAPPLNCGRGDNVAFAAGTDLYACVFAGALSQVGTSAPTNCGRGTQIGFAAPQSQ